jgi:hypothetical protein
VPIALASSNTNCLRKSKRGEPIASVKSKQAQQNSERITRRGDLTAAFFVEVGTREYGEAKASLDRRYQ